MIISEYVIEDTLEKLEKIIKRNTTPEQFAKIEKEVKKEFT